MVKLGSITTILVASVVGAAIGFGATTILNARESEEPAVVSVPQTDTKAADFRAQFRSLHTESVQLASEAARAAFDSAEYAEAANAALDDNANALADVVSQIYGTQIRQQYYDIWRTHLTLLVGYANATQKGDKAAADKAIADLASFVDAIADFWGKTNTRLAAASLKPAFIDYVNMLKGLVDTYAASDYTGFYTKEHQAYQHIAQLADALAAAIVKQNPSKF